jgi:triosephosphate isomerase (TIM)
MDAERTPLVAGNWKMNAGGVDGCELAAAVARVTSELDGVEVVVAPPFTALAAVSHELREARAPIGVAGQNMHWQEKGAFTGEISADMLKAAGCALVILGHSERRQLFGETDEGVARKVAAALAAGLTPIACVGETLAEREGGRTLEVVEGQVKAFVDELQKSPGSSVVAYEPVWAIGTGKVAQPADAQEVHAAIRRVLADASPDLARQTRILYGGSVNAANAEALLAQPDIDGALVGGASLEPEGFGKIVETASKLAQQLAGGGSGD